MSNEEYDFTELIDAWHKLQEAHLALDGAQQSSQAYDKWYEALLQALLIYSKALERMRPRKLPNEGNQATGG